MTAEGTRTRPSAPSPSVTLHEMNAQVEVHLNYIFCAFYFVEISTNSLNEASEGKMCHTSAESAQG